MDSKLLRTFVAVANHGSFTGAAKELYIAQSAVSKHINQLERELGAQLFLRDTRMVRLTAAGEGFYRDSLDILRRMDAARTALQGEQGGEPRTAGSGRFQRRAHGDRGAGAAVSCLLERGGALPGLV